MKVTTTAEIDGVELDHHLRELTERLATSKLTQIIEETATDLVRVEVMKILEPLVVRVLTDEKFNFRRRYDHFSFKQKIEDTTRRHVVEYLDEPCFLYSKEASKPSHRLHGSSSCHVSRLEHFLLFAIKRYFDEHIEAKVGAMLDKYLGGKEKVETVARQQMKELLKEKLG